MKKLAKTVLTLGAVFTLAACGGVKWKTVTLEEFLDAASATDIEEAMMIKLREAKERITYATTDGEVIDTKYTYNSTYTTTVDMDMKKMTAHITINSTTVMDSVNDEEDENDEESVSLFVALNKELGFIAVNENEKEYSVIYSNEYLEQKGSDEYTADDICRDTLIELIGMLSGGSIFFGEFNLFFADDYFIDDSFYPDSKYDVKYETAEGGCFKGTAKVTGSYDDGYQFGYKVDFTENSSSEMRDYKLVSSLYDYKETGKYYLTDTTLVDYSYSSKREVKTSSYKSFKVPALDTYTEVAFAD